ncbi:MAG TPA: alkaline phosphatase family protein [Kineosporiaceae bacterium]|nr:alkaline phosphatase family protein [Kineosporiaceae bacterium]
MTGRTGPRRRLRSAAVAALLAGVVCGVTPAAPSAAVTGARAAGTPGAPGPGSTPVATPGNGGPADPSSRTATPIKHFVMLMQGDRTFDNYFGTYPGADGPPSGTCQVFVRSKPLNGCAKPYSAHGLTLPVLAAGQAVVEAQYDGGQMDGFVAAYRNQGRDGTPAMAFYDRRDLPFTWAVADRYVLFDRFFSGSLYGTRLNRSYWVSAAPAPGGGSRIPRGGYGDLPTIFDRLQASGVSWKFYVQGYDPRQTFRSGPLNAPSGQTVRVPLLNYARFLDDPRLSGHIVDLEQYYQDLTRGTLPAVAYIASSGDNERSAQSLRSGQLLEQRLTTQLMLSRYWDSSALMWTYDGSGGWYDHVAPPRNGSTTLGFRVPALLVSSYARTGVVDHTELSYASALRFIEDNWGVPPLTALDQGARSLVSAFDFPAGPRPPVLITLDTPPPGQVVSVSAAYWAYGTATVGALLVFLGALVLPGRLRLPGRWRRGIPGGGPGGAGPDPGGRGGRDGPDGPGGAANDLQESDGPQVRDLAECEGVSR